ncbi:MAG: META domain-containing protein, partial [Acinetobacter junii]|nr:META domain-containing protein [Acinetobacter junii]
MSEQITVKNIISYLKAFFNKSLIISTALVISACQSQPQTTQSKTLQPKRVNQLPTLQVRKSTDG